MSQTNFRAVAFLHLPRRQPTFIPLDIKYIPQFIAISNCFIFPIFRPSFIMAEPTEQTAPVVDEVAKPVVEETNQPEVDEAIKPADKDDSEAAPSAPAAPDAVENATDIDAADDDVKSRKVTLADLCAKGTTLYAQRSYEEATEIFSRASVLQAEINGETAPENAEILFHYGRSLFRVGQSKSDVLGGPAASDNKKKANGDSKPKKPEAAKAKQDGAAEDKEEAPKSDVDAKKPLFQFTGDENFDESDEDEVSGHEHLLMPGRC